MSRELLQQALDALETHVPHVYKDRGYPPIAALRAALAQPEPEPVHQFRLPGCCDWYDGFPDDRADYETRTLYSSPPAAPPAAPAPAVPLTNERVLPAFDAWKDRYGLPYEPNWSKETETDCLAAFEAGIAAGQLALLSMRTVEHKPLSNSQIVDATAQIDYSENGYVIRLARAIEQAHGIGTQGGGK